MSKINIVAAFPGVGKTTMTRKGYQTLIDLDSALFPKDDEDRFDKYIESIKEHLQKGNSVLVSVHPELIEKLSEEGLSFYLIYPNIHLKDEYIKRYKDRGDWNAFLAQLETNWDDYIFGLMNLSSKAEKTLELDSDRFLNDVIDYHPLTGFSLK